MISSSSLKTSSDIHNPFSADWCIIFSAVSILYWLTNILTIYLCLRGFYLSTMHSFDDTLHAVLNIPRLGVEMDAGRGVLQM